MFDEISIYKKETTGFAGGIHILMHPDIQKHQRSIYNFLDLLGDIGGLYGSLSGLGWLLMTILG